MKKSNNNKLAIQMLIAMLAGIGVGLVFMFIRESMGADSSLWKTINNVLFQDITAQGAESAIGLFYICGQMFVRALQLVIVPMVFSSIVMVIAEISEASTLGRISAKTIGWFMTTTFCALLFGGAVIVEQIFSWPGLGLVTMNAIVSRDYPVIMGVCLLSAIVVLAANLITDIVYALVDPTIRY